jgi:hypothetical protein
VRSLGEAFRVRSITEKRRKKLHAEHALRSYIVGRIEQLHRRKIAIGRNLFDRVGAETGTNSSFVSRVYYAEASVGWRKLVQHLRISSQEIDIS